MPGFTSFIYFDINVHKVNIDKTNIISHVISVNWFRKGKMSPQTYEIQLSVTQKVPK